MLRDVYEEHIDGENYVIEWYDAGYPSEFKYFGNIYKICNDNKVFILDVNSNKHTKKPSSFINLINDEKERLLRVSNYNKSTNVLESEKKTNSVRLFCERAMKL